MALRDDAPYLQSRAALREIYGPRRIDGRAPQSANDTTPSGRMKYLEQKYMRQGAKAGEAASMASGQVRQDFYDNFGPRSSFSENFKPRGIALPPMPPNQSFAPQPMSNDYNSVVSQRGSLFGPSPFKPITPTPLAINLNTPSPLGASALASFLPPSPSSYTPPWQKMQQTYMGSIFQNASRWLNNG